MEYAAELLEALQAVVSDGYLVRDRIDEHVLALEMRVSIALPCALIVLQHPLGHLLDMHEASSKAARYLQLLLSV